MCAEIVFEICFGIAKRHMVLLKQRVYLEASFEVQEPTDLCLRQGTSPIASTAIASSERLGTSSHRPLSAADTSSGRSIVTFMVTPILAPAMGPFWSATSD
jgi:hypothetical protein